MRSVQTAADDLPGRALLDRPVPGALRHGPQTGDHHERVAKVANRAALRRTGSPGRPFLSAVVRLDPQHLRPRSFRQTLPQGVAGLQPLGAVGAGQTLDLSRTPHHEENQRQFIIHFYDFFSKKKFFFQNFVFF